MSMDIVSVIIVSAVSVAVGLALLYFVVKNAIKNALIEDRAFQAKVERMKAEKPAR